MPSGPASSTPEILCHQPSAKLQMVVTQPAPWLPPSPLLSTRAAPELHHRCCWPQNLRVSPCGRVDPWNSILNLCSLLYCFELVLISSSGTGNSEWQISELVNPEFIFKVIGPGIGPWFQLLCLEVVAVCKLFPPFLLNYYSKHFSLYRSTAG